MSDVKRNAEMAQASILSKIKSDRDLLVSRMESLSRQMENQARRLAEWDPEAPRNDDTFLGNFLPVNTAGEIQAAGSSIDMTVAKLDANYEAFKMIRWATQAD